MDSSESNKIWERICHEADLKERVMRQIVISKEADKQIFTGVFNDHNLSNENKELIYQLSMSFRNSMYENPNENIFALDLEREISEKLITEDLIFIEKKLSEIFGYIFKIRREYNRKNFIVMVNTQDIYRWD